MKVPDSCTGWRDQMNDGHVERGVLANIEGDGCLPPNIEAAFFGRLAERGPFTDPASAWDAAKAVVNERPELFYCVGEPVGDDRFASLVRFVMVRAWVYLIPDSAQDILEGLRARFPIAGPDWPSDLSDNQRRAISAALTRELQVGRPGRIAWVSDDGVVPWRSAGLRMILRCLGMPHFEEEAWTLVLSYNREVVADGLFVPRALDGIENLPFRVQEDCSASAGLTEPTAEAGSGARGYPEAVHRSAIVAVDAVSLKAINGDLR